VLILSRELNIRLCYKNNEEQKEWTERIVRLAGIPHVGEYVSMSKEGPRYHIVDVVHYVYADVDIDLFAIRDEDEE
jgi:hypothetical protein